MYRTRFTLIVRWLFLLIPFTFLGQEKSDLTSEELENYSEQARQMVDYLEGTLNFLGDPTQTTSDKDIIINSSFLKMFQSEETQIEDDLDPNREMAMNKDVQAYLKDIVFFYKRVTFGFEVNGIDQLVNEKGQVYFKVTMNRHLDGITVEGDSISNNQLRYMEINLDQVQKDLKIASLYTTKPDRSAELRRWWETMPESWKKVFGDSIFFYQPKYPEMTDAPTVFDTIALWEVLSFGDSSFVYGRWRQDIRLDSLVAFEGDTVAYGSAGKDTLLTGELLIDTTLHYVKVYDTVPVEMAIIQKHLNKIVNMSSLDVSGNQDLMTLAPVNELTELVSIDFSGTPISDLTPLRNLNKLEVIHCSNTRVNSLEPLRFASRIRELDCSHTPVADVTVLGNLRNLNSLNIGYTKTREITSLGSLGELTQLSIAGLDINDLNALEQLPRLSDLNLSASKVTSLTSVGMIHSLQSLNISECYVTRLDPLKDLENLTVLQANSSRISNLEPLSGNTSLKFVYCDNTNINASIAAAFMGKNPGCLVIYNTAALRQWWDELPPVYQQLIREKMGLGTEVSTEQLHEIINQTRVDFTGRKDITTIEPLQMLHRLEVVILENSGVTDLTPLAGLNNLKMLNINQTGVKSFEPLIGLNNLEEVRCEHTDINDLMPLSGNANLQTVFCDHTGVGSSNVVPFRKTLPQCLVVYQTDQLKTWWNGLSSTWQNVFIEQANLDAFDGIHLQQLVNLTKVVVTDQDEIDNLKPMDKFLYLEVLTINNTRVDDISPLIHLGYLNELNLPNNPISRLDSIAEILSLRTLNLENTPFEDLEAVGRLSWLETLNIAGTMVRNLKDLSDMQSLEYLYINNTSVKNFKGVEELPNLKEIKCYRTSISSKTIDKFREERPEVNLDYY